MDAGNLHATLDIEFSESFKKQLDEVKDVIAKVEALSLGDKISDQIVELRDLLAQLEDIAEALK